MAKKNEEKNKPFTVRFNPSYWKKIEFIVNETGLSRPKIMNEILGSYFEGRVLTNDFIELENPFYFNMKELKEKGIVKAITKPSIHDLPKYYIVYKIPNNLDVFDKDSKTFYSGSTSEHKGIYVHYTITFGEAEVEVNEDFTDSINTVKEITEKHLIFNYDSSANSLEISLVPFEDLYLYVPEDSDILEKIEAEKDKFYYNIILDEETKEYNFIEWLETFEVIQSYKAVKNINIYVKENKERLDKLLNDTEEDLPELFEDVPDFSTMSGSEYKEYHVKELKGKPKDKD